MKIGVLQPGETVGRQHRQEMTKEFLVVFVVSRKGRWSQRQFRDLGKSDWQEGELAGWEREESQGTKG